MHGNAMLPQPPAQRGSAFVASSTAYVRRPLLPVATGGAGTASVPFKSSAAASSSTAAAAAAETKKPLSANEIHINAMLAQYNVPESLLVIRRGMVPIHLSRYLFICL